MARYKPYDLDQHKFIPVCYHDQILPGSFEHALNEIVEEHLDLTVFEDRYENDQTGRLAYDPAVLLTIVLYGYSKGIVSSRKLAEACERNVTFMALSADTRPHFTTIADFMAQIQIGVRAQVLPISAVSLIRPRFSPGSHAICKCKALLPEVTAMNDARFTGLP